MLLLAPEPTDEADDEDAPGRPPREARVLWPGEGRRDDGRIPGRLLAELREARACLRAGAHSSAVVMVRRLLEGVCADHGVRAAPLSQALRELRRRGLVDPAMLVLAEDLRLIGNEAAHIRAGRTAPEDAADAVVLAEALLEYLYVYSPKYQEFKKRRAAAGAPAPAPRRPNTPDTLAVKTLRRSRVPFARHDYAHDPAYGKSRRTIAAELGVGHDRMLKAVVVYVDGHVVLAVAPVGAAVDLDALAAASGGRTARLAPAGDVTRLGADVVSPLGLPLRVPAVVDAAVLRHRTVYVASGRHGLELELAPADLVRVIGASTAPIAAPPAAGPRPPRDRPAPATPARPDVPTA
ncbi:YbaK/EbsC family protein [Sphaerisporangium sp. TRM90804]|uniref:YbaK/EbsC family protein n=1 Tax=Sphaerisporangium sp. TRM90804 TaxID=3031113 RepID=UPI00244BAC6B|nr:YbaK/EbsC family protein [Sphaerisporangium sp. TRM90804]MDH2430670.1 YbaK/EbsC family protein [Sphaerisporangium sp. TRM90804]